MKSVKNKNKAKLQSQRNYLINQRYRSMMKFLKKEILIKIKEQTRNDISNSKELNFAIQKFQSIIDKAVKKNIIHKNTASRKKANLFKSFKNIN